jgi:hypothetical protein
MFSSGFNFPSPMMVKYAVILECPYCGIRSINLLTTDGLLHHG